MHEYGYYVTKVLLVADGLWTENLWGLYIFMRMYMNFLFTYIVMILWQLGNYGIYEISIFPAFKHFYAWDVHDNDDPIVFMESTFSWEHMIFYESYHIIIIILKFKVQSRLIKSMSYFMSWVERRVKYPFKHVNPIKK